MCLGNIPQDSPVDSTKKTGIYGYVDSFSVEYDSIGVYDILHINEYLRKTHDVN